MMLRSEMNSTGGDSFAALALSLGIMELSES